MNGPSPLQGLEPSTNCIVMPTKKSSLKKNPRRQNIDAPVAMATRVPRVYFGSVSPTRGGSLRIRGCDYYGTLNSSTLDSTSAVGSISLGSSSIFPRLAEIAKVFLKFRFDKLIVRLIGRTASTQAGNCGLMSLVNDLPASAETDVLNEAIVKNTENCLVVKGWENGDHRVPLEASGYKWYMVDENDTGSKFSQGSIWRTIPGTTSVGDLSWDVYLEYECEFDEAVSKDVNA